MNVVASQLCVVSILMMTAKWHVDCPYKVLSFIMGPFKDGKFTVEFAYVHAKHSLRMGRVGTP